MPRISLREIEELKNDPSAYRSKITSPAPLVRVRRSYHMCLKDSVFRFHKGGTISAGARAFLVDQLSRFKDEGKKAQSLASYDWYVTEHASGHVTFQTKLKVSVPLPARVSGTLTCSGQIDRIDYQFPRGYSVWFLRKGPVDDWRNELCMPLAQLAVANHLGVVPAEVSVGVYSFVERSSDQQMFSSLQIAQAEAELDGLIGQMGY